MKKVIMIILDGFGINSKEYGNAIKQAYMPTLHDLFNNYSVATLEASGEAVGLPDNQFGNSEVGHMTIGAGIKIKQDIIRCNEIMLGTTIEENEEYKNLVNHVNEFNSDLHLIGLVSDGGVHSDIKYIKNLLPHLKKSGINKIFFHAITDGRDTSIDSSISYLDDLENALKEQKLGHISTVCGRYYAMDRDNKWDRTKVYTDMLINGKGVMIKNYVSAIKACYKRDITDEFLPPIVLDETSMIKENDAILWLNFRSDRARQLLETLIDPNFSEYRIKKFNNLFVCSLTNVTDVDVKHYILEKNNKLYSIGEYFSDLGLSQARIAETEKYAHVTYFFNGASKVKLKKCSNFLIPSPKVKTYDETPAMSVLSVTDQVIKCLEKDFSFILVNIANPDMLGHTGNLEATKEGLEIVDDCLKQIIDAVDDNFYKLIVTADHGNCDEMLDENGNVLTTHSMNPVPFVIRDKYVKLKHKGNITQIAPTILNYMDIAIPKSMQDTKSLFVDDE